MSQSVRHDVVRRLFNELLDRTGGEGPEFTTIMWILRQGDRGSKRFDAATRRVEHRYMDLLGDSEVNKTEEASP